jgi:hypothetical protein
MDSKNICKKKLICEKHNIKLYKVEDKQNVFFVIECDINNNNIILKNLVNLKLFDLIFELNKDIIDKQVVLNRQDDSFVDLAIFFKNFSETLGTSKNYLCSKTVVNHLNNKTIFKSKSIKTPDKIIDNNNKEINITNYDLINYGINNLEFNYKDEHNMSCSYTICMNLQEELPNYMENMLGLIMKKVIFRLKTFIENI